MKRISLATWINVAVTVGGVVVTVLWFSFGTAVNGTQNTKDIAEVKANLVVMQASINNLQNSLATTQANSTQIAKNIDVMHDDIKGIYRLILENKSAMNGNVKYTEASY